MTQERVLEMYKKFISLGNVRNEVEEKTGDLVNKVTLMKLEVNIPDTLLSLGVAKTVEEAEEFISYVIGSASLAVMLGKQDGLDAMYDFMKIGFQIGLLAGKEMKGREVN